MKKILLSILAFFVLTGCVNDGDAHVEFQPTETTAEQTIELVVQKEYVMEAISCPSIRNEDGSRTYYLTLTQYDELLAEIRGELEQFIQGIVKDIDTFSSIDHDDEFRTFVVETSNAEFSFHEAASMITLFGCGEIYNAYAGNSEAVINIQYTHEGVEIYSCDSNQLG